MLWFYKKYARTEVYLWRIEEEAAFYAHRLGLSDAQWAALTQKHSHVDSLMQWLASRYLLLQILGADDYACLEQTPEGKWHLPQRNDVHFSISHSENVVAVAVAQSAVGIDVQTETQRLQRIAAKFIPAATLEKIKSNPQYNELLHLHWGTKEALFKAYGKGGLDFRQHLLLPDVVLDKTYKGAFVCSLSKPNEPEQQYWAVYEKCDSVWVCVVGRH